MPRQTDVHVHDHIRRRKETSRQHLITHSSQKGPGVLLHWRSVRNMSVWPTWGRRKDSKNLRMTMKKFQKVTNAISNEEWKGISAAYSLELEPRRGWAAWRRRRAPAPSTLPPAGGSLAVRPPQLESKTTIPKSRFTDFADFTFNQVNLLLKEGASKAQKSSLFILVSNKTFYLIVVLVPNFTELFVFL